MNLAELVFRQMNQCGLPKSIFIAVAKFSPFNNALGKKFAGLFLVALGLTAGLNRLPGLLESITEDAESERIENRRFLFRNPKWNGSHRAPPLRAITLFPQASRPNQTMILLWLKAAYVGPHRGLGARLCSQCSSFVLATMWHERGDFLRFNAQQMWNSSDATPYRGAIACRDKGGLSSIHA
jgi:hypothetical protein